MRSLPHTLSPKPNPAACPRPRCAATSPTRVSAAAALTRSFWRCPCSPGADAPFAPAHQVSGAFGFGGGGDEEHDEFANMSMTFGDGDDIPVDDEYAVEQERHPSVSDDVVRQRVMFPFAGQPSGCASRNAKKMR